MKFNKIEQIAETYNINLLKIYQQAINESINKNINDNAISLKEAISTDEAIAWLTKKGIENNYTFIPFLNKELLREKDNLKETIAIGLPLNRLISILSYSKQDCSKFFARMINDIYNSVANTGRKYNDNPGANMFDYKDLRDVVRNIFGTSPDDNYLIDVDIFASLLLDTITVASKYPNIKQLFISKKLKVDHHSIYKALNDAIYYDNRVELSSSITNALYPIFAKDKVKDLIKFFNDNVVAEVVTDTLAGVNKLIQQITELVNSYNAEHANDKSFFDFIANKNADSECERFVITNVSDNYNLFTNADAVNTNKFKRYNTYLLAGFQPFEIYIGAAPVK